MTLTAKMVLAYLKNIRSPYGVLVNGHAVVGLFKLRRVIVLVRHEDNNGHIGVEGRVAQVIGPQSQLEHPGILVSVVKDLVVPSSACGVEFGLNELVVDEAVGANFSGD